jgi:hypothetical protein
MPTKLAQKWLIRRDSVIVIHHKVVNEAQVPWAARIGFAKEAGCEKELILRILGLREYSSLKIIQAVASANLQTPIRISKLLTIIRTGAQTSVRQKTRIGETFERIVRGEELNVTSAAAALITFGAAAF